jgi:hypothetical protein
MSSLPWWTPGLETAMNADVCKPMSVMTEFLSKRLAQVEEADDMDCAEKTK